METNSDQKPGRFRVRDSFSAHPAAWTAAIAGVIAALAAIVSAIAAIMPLFG